MLRITLDETTSETQFILEGRLAGVWVTELRDVVMSSDTAAESISLNLTQVQFADEQGVSLLRELIASGVTIREASPFIWELLRQAV